jgi:multidrug transporter EmrE-like cation transporter
MMKKRGFATQAVAIVMAVAFVTMSCNAEVGVGVAYPVYGGWGGTPYGGPYGGVGVGVGIPIW